MCVRNAGVAVGQKESLLSFLGATTAVKGLCNKPGPSRLTNKLVRQ